MFEYLHLLLIIVLFAITPGPGITYTISVGINSKLIATFFAVLGIVLGDMLYVMLAVYGFYFLQNIITEIELWVSILGGCYLLILAIKVFINRNKALNLEVSNDSKQKLISGFIISCSNPKVIIFYFTFLPNVLNLSNLGWLQIILIELTVLVGIFIPVFSIGVLATSIKTIFYDNYRYLNIFSSLLILGVSLFLFYKVV